MTNHEKRSLRIGRMFAAGSTSSTSRIHRFSANTQK